MNDIKYKETTYKTFEVQNTKVLIQVIKNDGARKYGDIYLPDTEKYENMRLGIGKVLAVGKEVDSGIKAGDYVLYDFYSSFNRSDENVITNAENVILKLKDEKEVDDFLNYRL